MFSVGSPGTTGTGSVPTYPVNTTPPPQSASPAPPPSGPAAGGTTGGFYHVSSGKGVNVDVLA